MERASTSTWAFLVAFRDAQNWDAGGAFDQETGPTSGILFFHGGKEATDAARKIALHNELAKVGIAFGQTEQETLERAYDLANYAPPGQILIERAVIEVVRSKVPNLDLVEFGPAADLRSGKLRVFLWLNHDRPIPPPSPPSTVYGTIVARQRQLDALAEVTAGPKFVTVHGGPGVGTTTFLKRFKGEVQDQFEHGAYYLNLGDIRRGEVALPTICRSLDIYATRVEDLLPKLVDTFKELEALMIIDDCTAVVNHVAPIVATLAAECPNLLLLVGTKRLLKIPGETVFELRGMDYPSVGEHWESMREYDAVDFFESRARAAKPGFQLDEDNADDIAMICQRVDGNPLAIEMIAPKMRTMSPKHLLTILPDLMGSSKSELGTTVGWWVSQLSERAQILLPRLTVFNGAFSIGWVAKVCADDKLPREALYAAFEDLKDSALLKDSDLRTDEHMLYLSETIQPFAKESFRNDKAEERIRENHRDWCLELAKEAETGLVGERQDHWLRVMDAAYGDMRSVINEARSYNGDLSLSARILIACHPYLYERNYFNEGFTMAEKLLKIRGANRLPEYARLLNMAGAYAYLLSRYKEARKYATRSHNLAKKRGDDHQVGRSSNTIAMAYEGLGEFEKAHPFFVEAYVSLRGKDPNDELSAIANLLGNEANQGLYDESMTHFYAGQAIRDECKDPSTISSFVLNACHLAIMSGRWSEAGRLLVDGLEVCLSADDKRGIGLGMRSASRLAVGWGRFGDAAIFIGAAISLLLMNESKPPKWSDEFFAQAEEAARANLGNKKYEARLFQGGMLEPSEMLDRLRKLVDECA